MLGVSKRVPLCQSIAMVVQAAARVFKVVARTFLGICGVQDSTRNVLVPPLEILGILRHC